MRHQHIWQIRQKRPKQVLHTLDSMRRESSSTPRFLIQCTGKLLVPLKSIRTSSVEYFVTPVLSKTINVFVWFDVSVREVRHTLVNYFIGCRFDYCSSLRYCSQTFATTAVHSERCGETRRRNTMHRTHLADTPEFALAFNSPVHRLQGGDHGVQVFAWHGTSVVSSGIVGMRLLVWQDRRYVQQGGVKTSHRQEQYLATDLSLLAIRVSGTVCLSHGTPRRHY